MKRVMSSAIAALFLGATSSAFAYDGFATGNVNLRAGPDVEYPIVTTIPAGAPLEIQGCTDAWEWCDVVFDGARGWVAGNYIQYEYNDQPVLLPSYGAAIGVPIVSFVIADYWGHYYRNSSFWGEHDHWYSHPYVRHAPPAAFYGPVHDWGHDHAHYDHDHGYSGHGNDYHGSSHGGSDYHGQSHGNADYHATSHGADYQGASHGNDYHGAPHAAPTAHPDAHATQQVSHNTPNYGQPQGQHADTYHAPPGHNSTPTGQQAHTGPGAQQAHAAPVAQQVHAAPVAQQAHAAPATQQNHSSSHDKSSSSHDKDKDKDKGHR